MTEVLFIGTGDAFGSGGRRNTAILVREGSETLLLDCGPTTLAGLKDCGISPAEIDAVAITHFHGDHVAGVPFLLLDYLYETVRDRPLEILGPPDIQGRIETLSRELRYDTGARRPYTLSYHEYTSGDPIKTGGFSVTPLPAHHTPETHPHMLWVRTATRTIVFTGDTGWCDPLPERVGEADLLISECVFMEECEDRFEFHLCHRKLAATRDQFRVARTILTHLGSEILDDIDRIEFDIAHDGLRLEI